MLDLYEIQYFISGQETKSTQHLAGGESTKEKKRKQKTESERKTTTKR